MSFLRFMHATVPNHQHHEGVQSVNLFYWLVHLITVSSCRPKAFNQGLSLHDGTGQVKNLS